MKLIRKKPSPPPGPVTITVIIELTRFVSDGVLEEYVANAISAHGGGLDPADEMFDNIISVDVEVR